MADLKVRNLDDHVAVLKARARQKGISLEEEAYRTLALSVARDRAELVERAKALHAAAGGRPGRPEMDSARIIREELDRTRPDADRDRLGSAPEGRGGRAQTRHRDAGPGIHPRRHGPRRAVPVSRRDGDPLSLDHGPGASAQGRGLRLSGLAEQAGAAIVTADRRLSELADSRKLRTVLLLSA
jgi:plasmid stability protein